ncbi:MAG: tol-pal system-associated acyl-CoA thioesterase [Pseudomonadota bacterium]
MAAFVWQVRVYYEDTDAGGVVYHANYLNYLERARTEWMRARGLEQDRLISDQGIIFAVRSVNLEFIKPARFNQRLRVEVDIAQANRLAIQFTQRVLLQNGDGAETVHQADVLLCAANVKVVTLDAANMRPRRMPNPIFVEIMRGHGN